MSVDQDRAVPGEPCGGKCFPLTYGGGPELARFFATHLGADVDLWQALSLYQSWVDRGVEQLWRSLPSGDET